jgi:arabinogalactan oligomer/maltooligosaccharide transport system permease protein
MSSDAARTPALRQPSAAAAAMSLPSRAMAFFTGPVGLTVKFTLLGIVNALAIWAGAILADRGKWIPVAVLVAATVGIDAVYLSKRALPAKFLIPGTVFLLAFHVIPILYTIQVAFTNYSTGHIITKQQAIKTIKLTTLSEPANGRSYAMAPARDESGKLVLLLVDETSHKPYVGSPDGLKPLPPGVLKFADDAVQSARGYKLLKGAELFSLDRVLSAYTVPTSGDAAIRPQGIDGAIDLEPTLRYHPGSDTFTRISDGTVYRDNGRGSFVTASGEEIEPGWKTGVGFRTIKRVFDDPLIRGPFLRVFAWTLAFAVLSVLLSFALGLFLAVTLQKKIRFQRFYRIALVVPYAIPGFLTILVWAGLLNDDFGVVNRLLHVHVPWLFGDAYVARLSILLVSTWLTFPYFFLVSLGALQSIPGELIEAARVDGAAAWQVFRRITLPLLLVAVSPLLIASFAFNFNNFNVIYLLTGGNPPANDGSIAGQTDILISYTYKLAFAAGKGQDFALACAVSIFIFFIVALISGVAFWRTQSFQSVN